MPLSVTVRVHRSNLQEQFLAFLWRCFACQRAVRELSLSFRPATPTEIVTIYASYDPIFACRAVPHIVSCVNRVSHAPPPFACPAPLSALRQFALPASGKTDSRFLFSCRGLALSSQEPQQHPYRKL